MSEDIHKKPPADPGTAEANDLVVRGADGDPLPDPEATTMIERESYERVIEGVKSAADAAAHLALTEPENSGIWGGMARRLDTVRRIAVRTAGIEDNINQKETERVRKKPMAWKVARERFREGLKQAEGGMRQLGVCHRGDIAWLTMADVVADLQRKLAGAAKFNTRSSLILPPNFQNQG